jgi:hypothetical protein
MCLIQSFVRTACYLSDTHFGQFPLGLSRFLVKAQGFGSRFYFSYKVKV